MSEFQITIDGEAYIAHYGVKGMKQGVRRWTNPDGTLNEAGKRRYNLNRNWKPAPTRQQFENPNSYFFNTSNPTVGYDERKAREASAAETKKFINSGGAALGSAEVNKNVLKGRMPDGSRQGKSKEEREAEWRASYRAKQAKKTFEMGAEERKKQSKINYMLKQAKRIEQSAKKKAAAKKKGRNFLNLLFSENKTTSIKPGRR